MQAGGSGGPRSSRTSQTSHTSHISDGPQPQRQSGGPAAGSQPPYDPNDPKYFGLPDLTGYTPRMTPRMTPRIPPAQPSAPGQPEQPQQPHTLGVTAKIARARSSTGSPSLPPRSNTLTQQMRALQPPDVARQTIDEQKMLANELLTLPDALATSGLAKSHEASYMEAVGSFTDLANAAWIAIAEERLEQSGAEEPYRQHAIAIARRATRLRNESQLAANNTQFPLPRKRPFFWRRRIQLRQAGIRDWLAHLAMPPDVRVMGRSLTRLRGNVALAEASNLELALWSLFPAVVADVTILLLLGILVALVAAIGLDTKSAVGGLIAAATVTLAVRIAVSLLLHGPARLDRLFALSVFSAQRSPRANRDGSPIVARLLRGWGVLLALAGLLGMVAALGYSVWGIIQQQMTPPTQPLGWVALVGDLILRALLLPTVVGLAGLAALALPLLLLSAIRSTGELAGNIAWAPAARRSALPAAFQIVLWLAAGVVTVLAVFAANTHLRDHPLTMLRVASWSQVITWQTAALFVIPALVLFIGLDLPYRIGIVRWRHFWLHELTTRRADIDAHVRRLSAVDPQTGMQDASEENLRAMQYDMVLLQFYATRTEETRKVSTWAYSWLVGIGVVLLLAVVALAVDGHAQQLANLVLSVHLGG